MISTKHAGIPIFLGRNESDYVCWDLFVSFSLKIFYEANL